MASCGTEGSGAREEPSEKASEELCEVCVTGPDGAALAELTRRLVEARICACGHNFSEIRSIYRWRGRIYDHAEARVALHTRRSLVPLLVEEVKRQHPYQVPAVFVLSLIGGNQEYLQWILDETRPQVRGDSVLD